HSWRTSIKPRFFLQSLERAPQLGSSAHRPHAHGNARRTRLLGNFLHATPLQFLHCYHDLFGGRKFLHCHGQQLASLAPFPFPTATPAWQPVQAGSSKFGRPVFMAPPSLLAQMIQGCVNSNSSEPMMERCAAVILSQAPPSLNESLLCKVLELLVVPFVMVED